MDKYNIMILDSESSSSALRKTLAAAGFDRIDVFSDPAEAMDMLRTKKCHIMLADMDLPGMDGIEVLKTVKQYDPMTQVIMMTGCSTIDRVLTCLELGANEYVLKPFRNESCIPEAVTYAIHKLERWKAAIRDTMLQKIEAASSVEQIS
jgi:DNA-binding NtrC family response regulator